jgi:hypothetical protein
MEALALHVRQKKKTIVIHTDDCTYSGNQFYTSFFQIPEACINMGITPSDFCYYLAFPVISNSAIRLFNEYLQNDKLGFAIIPTKSMKIETLYRHMIRALGQTQTEALFALLGRSSKTPEAVLFQWTQQSHAVYFDHKLADSVSILNKVLAFAPIRDPSFPNGTKITTRNLIKGCEDVVYSPNDPALTITEFDTVCPVSFYKTIPYTFGGAKMDKHVLEDKTFSEFIAGVSIKQTQKKPYDISKKMCTLPHCNKIGQFVCARCKSVIYCSQKCQELDWRKRGHFDSCIINE